MLDRHYVVTNTECIRHQRSIVKGLWRGEAIGQHHAAHACRAERVGREHRHQRGIDAAGETQHYARKAVLVDIVAQPQHAGGIVVPVALLERGDGPIEAAPAVAGALEPHCCHLFAKSRKLEGERAVAMQAERRAVEYQLILAADLIDIDERQIALGDPLDRDVEAHVVLVAPIGRAVRHDHELGAGLSQALDHVLERRPALRLAPAQVAAGEADADHAAAPA